MHRQRVHRERKPARRTGRRNEVLPLDPRDPDIARVKEAQRTFNETVHLDRR